VATTLKSRVVKLAVAAGVAAVASLGGGAVAGAGTTDLSPTSSITIYQTPNHTGSSQTIAYTCVPIHVISAAPIGSYINRPPLNCSLVLVGRTGDKHQLCDGRGVVPLAFRTGSRLMTQPGVPSKPCPVIGPKA
jgi:hypothetical protein